MLAALAGLADELPDTVRQVAAFLDSQLARGHIVAADGGVQDAPAAVRTAQAVLAEVQASAAALALLLTRAEAAMLGLAPPKP